MMNGRFTPARPAGALPQATEPGSAPRSEDSQAITALPPTPEAPADTGSTKPVPSPADTATVPPEEHKIDTLATPSPGIPRSLSSEKLLLPVAGIRPDQLTDTYNDARSEGRVHNAIDIMAPHDSPVLAAADGRIVKLFQSQLGGTTIYQLGTDSTTVFYYAHLDHYAPGLFEGAAVRRGDVIAYVGDTGNAGPGNYHLHFAIWLITDPKHYWDGIDINPYPLLRPTP
jgi:murein DD-endopeptidase MepM/ murein hydrolase activator NlpD